MTTTLLPLKKGWPRLVALLNEKIIPGINERTPIQGDLVLLVVTKKGVELNLDAVALKRLIAELVNAVFLA